MPQTALDAPLSYLDTEGELPYEYYERVRAKGGIVWDEPMRSWVVVDHAMAQTILRDDVLFAHPYTTMQAREAYLKVRSGNPRSMMFLSGEKHRAFHKWWLVELLSPRAVKQHQPMIDAWIDQLIDRLDGRATFDLVDEFAERVPLGVFAALLDLPQRDLVFLDRVKALNDSIAAFASAANAQQLEGEGNEKAKRIADDAIAAGEELNAILLPLVQARRAGTGEDFISRLWAGGTKVFDDWNELDTLDACRRLLFAGIDTTTHAICNAYYMLLSNNALRQEVLAGDAKVMDRFVEEAFRLNGSVQFRPRRVMSDTKIGDVDLPAGAMVLVALIGANRDPEHYGCPNRVDLDRARPHDHLAFNYGPRTCLGMHLARAELASALSRGLARWPTLRLETTHTAPMFEGFLMRSYRPLHVRTD
ncbi:MAG: cytochrome P450 [bacterium]|nr:cytochrome P450 [bacterium]